jgi:hypothetical protein
VREFREWLETMPRGVFEKRVVGACDASMENGNGGAPTPPRYYSREGARRCLQFLARKLNADDLATAWGMIQARLREAGLQEARFDPDEAPLRRNGNGH